MTQKNINKMLNVNCVFLRVSRVCLARDMLLDKNDRNALRLTCTEAADIFDTVPGIWGKLAKTSAGHIQLSQTVRHKIEVIFEIFESQTRGSLYSEYDIGDRVRLAEHYAASLYRTMPPMPTISSASTSVKNGMRSTCEHLVQVIDAPIAKCRKFVTLSLE